MNIKRGDIVLAKFDPTRGSEIGKTRPCLVVQNDLGNQFSPTTIVVGITSKWSEKTYPTMVFIEPKDSGLTEKSVILCDQIRTISKAHRIIKRLGSLKREPMNQVNEALKASLALD